MRSLAARRHGVVVASWVLRMCRDNGWGPNRSETLHAEIHTVLLQVLRAIAHMGVNAVQQAWHQTGLGSKSAWLKPLLACSRYRSDAMSDH